MHRTSLLGRFLGVLTAVLLVSEVKAQPVWATFENTVIVDPELDAGDFQSIQDAIDSVGTPLLRTTILIYAGEYEENLVLESADTNINLVGVDPSAVIIRTPADTDAITIIGDGPRHHLIANLTIITNDATAGEGRGIVIRKETGSTPPSNITVRNVTITTQAANSIGIVAEDAVEDVRFEGVTILCEGDDSKGFEFAPESSRITIRETAIECDGTDSIAIDVGTKSHLLEVSGCTITVHGLDSTGIRTIETTVATYDLDLSVTDTQFNQLAKRSIGISIDSDSPNTNVAELSVASCRFLIDYPQPEDQGDDWAIKIEGAFDRIRIEDLFFLSRVHSGKGISASDTLGLTMSNSTMLAQDANLLLAGHNTVVVDSTFICNPRYGDHGQTGNDTAAIWGNDISGLYVANCVLEARQHALRLTNATANVVVSNSELRGTHEAILIEGGADIEISNSTIDASSIRGSMESPSPPHFSGIYVRNSGLIDPENIRIQNCDINVYSNRANTDAIGVRVAHASPEDAQAVLVSNCNIKVRAGTTADRAIGATSEEADALYIVGGSIQTFDENEREVDQYDVRNGMQQGVASFAGIRTSGVGYSKWLGPIEAAATPASSIQRSLSVAAQDDDGVLAATNLQATENTVTTGITDPDVPRVLSVTANEAGMDDDVIIIGTNFAGERITDIITLNGTATVVGKKPFAAIDKIILPAGQAQQTVIVGTTNMIGLRFPIAGASSVQQQSKLATISGVQVYRIVTTDSIEAAYSTVDLAATSDDSWEWVVLGSN